MVEVSAKGVGDVWVLTVVGISCGRARRQWLLMQHTYVCGLTVLFDTESMCVARAALCPCPIVLLPQPVSLWSASMLCSCPSTLEPSSHVLSCMESSS